MPRVTTPRLRSRPKGACEPRALPARSPRVRWPQRWLFLGIIGIILLLLTRLRRWPCADLQRRRDLEVTGAASRLAVRPSPCAHRVPSLMECVAAGQPVQGRNRGPARSGRSHPGDRPRSGHADAAAITFLAWLSVPTWGVPHDRRAAAGRFRSLPGRYLSPPVAT
jgi:hypothetical protein